MFSYAGLTFDLVGKWRSDFTSCPRESFHVTSFFTQTPANEDKRDAEKDGTGA